MYEYKNETTLIPENDYEVVIEDIGVKIIPSGTEKLQIKYRIRDDVEGQGYGHRVLFEDIWKEKESPEHFNRKRINKLLSTQKVKDGTVFNSINDVINFLKENNYLIAHVGIVFDDYRGEDVNKISYYKPSKHLPQSVTPVAPSGVLNLTKEEVEKAISDDDLPF